MELSPLRLQRSPQKGQQQRSPGTVQFQSCRVKFEFAVPALLPYTTGNLCEEMGRVLGFCAGKGVGVLCCGRQGGGQAAGAERPGLGLQWGQSSGAAKH